MFNKNRLRVIDGTGHWRGRPPLRSAPVVRGLNLGISCYDPFKAIQANAIRASQAQNLEEQNLTPTQFTGFG